MKKPHRAIHNLGPYAHAPKPKQANTAGPSKNQMGDMKAPLIGKSVPPASVSKRRTRKV